MPLVLNIGEFVGFQTFFHIYNLNPQTKLSREKSLEGVDGLVFVANRDTRAGLDNKKALQELEGFLKKKERVLFHFPMVLQYNKSDLKEKTLP